MGDGEITFTVKSPQGSDLFDHEVSASVVDAEDSNGTDSDGSEAQFNDAEAMAMDENMDKMSRIRSLVDSYNRAPSS